MRKIVGVIGQNNVTLLCLNQLKTAIGVMYGDPDVTPGGRAIPFHASVRIRLSSGNQVKDAAGNVIGIHVIATIKKNKIAPPFRKYFFDIVFGKGIVEHEYVLDEVRSHCEKNKVLTDYTDAKGNVSKVELSITGTGAWKTFAVNDAATGEVLIEKKFTKNGFDEIMNDPAYKPFVDKIIDAAYVVKYDTDVEIVGETPVTDEEVTSE